MLSAALFACILSLSSPRTAPAAEIPDTYERMSFVQVSHRIPTGVQAAADLKIDIVYRDTSALTATVFPVAARAASGAPDFILASSRAASYPGSVHVSVSGYGAFLTNVKPNNELTRLMFDMPGKKLAYNGTEQTITPAGTFTAGAGELAFGGFLAQSANYGNFELYMAKFYKAGALVRDFVAVRRRSDNVCGMFDLVSGSFFVPVQGTGACKTFAEAPWRI